MESTAEATVLRFLSTLDHDHREGFLGYAENTYSIYEIWLYANVLGYGGSFRDLEEWVQANYPKLNKRQLLLNETIKLEADIEILRQQVYADLIKPDIAASRIAHLSKELRGHLVEIDKMSKSLDRRGLILAGADRVLRELKMIFKGNDDMLNALEIAGESVWQLITGEG